MTAPARLAPNLGQDGIDADLVAVLADACDRWGLARVVFVLAAIADCRSLPMTADDLTFVNETLRWEDIPEARADGTGEGR